MENGKIYSVVFFTQTDFVALLNDYTGGKYLSDMDGRDGLMLSRTIDGEMQEWFDLEDGIAEAEKSPERKALENAIFGLITEKCGRAPAELHSDHNGDVWIVLAD